MNEQTILIVDDSLEDCAVFRRYLLRDSNRAYRILEAHSGKEARECLRTETPDCVLLDYHLPDTDGMTLLQSLIDEDESLRFPVVMLTGSGSTVLAVRAIHQGIHDYLLKDALTAEALLRSINNAIEKHVLLRQVEAQGEELQRKNAELEAANKALQESSHFLQSVINVTPSTLSIFDVKERRNIFINRTVASVIGYTSDEIQVMGTDVIRNLMHPDDLLRSEEHLIRVLTMNDNEISDFEFRMRDREGGWHWFHSRDAVFLREEAGSVKQIVGTATEITERKKADDSLRAAHDTFRHLVDNSPFGIYAVDGDFRLVQVSAGAQKVFENVRPLIGRDFAEVIRIIWLEPFASDVIKIFRNTLTTGEPYHDPSTTEKRQDTDTVEAYDWKIERVTLPDGRFGVVCHFYDLSERQHYESMLRASEERMRLATEATGVGIWEWNLPTGQIRWDAQMFRIYSIAPTADGFVDYRDWSGSVFPEDLPEHEAILQDTMRQSGQSQREFRIQRQDDGTLRWIEAVETVRTTAQGQVEWVVGTNLDITERKQAEAVLRASEEFNRTVLESSPDCVKVLDAEGRLEFMNQNGLCAMEIDDFGALRGQPWWQLWPEAERAKVRAAVETALRGEAANFIAHGYIYKGNSRWWDVTVAPVAPAGGEGGVVSLISVSRDITERKQQQQEIEELNARLHRAVYEGSHRIKNHLQVLAGLVDMQMPEGNEQVSADVLQRMKNHIQALAAIHDVLTLTTKENAENDVLPIKPLLERLIPMLQLSGGTHRIRFDVEDALLSARQASSLVLVLNELVSNGVKHGKSEVDATLKISKGYGVLEVCDDGAGFPSDFNPRKAANTGLDIVGSIARTDLRGQVVYDNHPKGGGRVTVTFPLLMTVKTQENVLSPE